MAGHRRFGDRTHLPKLADQRGKRVQEPVDVALVLDTSSSVWSDLGLIKDASRGLVGTIEAYASGTVDPRPLVAATVGLDGVGDVLAGLQPTGAGPGPKIQVTPQAPPSPRLR